MAQELVEYPDGVWAIDMDLVHTIVRSYVLSRAQLQYSKTVVIEKWIGPDIHNFEVDWDKVNEEKKHAPQLAWDIHNRALCYGMKPELRRLERMVQETRLNKNQWAQNLKDSMSETMKNVEKSVSRAETGITIAKGVRDASVGTLAVGATVLSGGTAAGLVGAAAFSSGLDAVVTLQDTATSGNPIDGDLKAAAFTFASKFAINLIPVGKGSDQLLMIILKNEAEVFQAGAQALVEGKTMEQALVKTVEQAAAQVLGAGAGKLLSTGAAHKLLLKTAYPMTLRVRYPHPGYLGRLAQTKEFTVGTAGKIIETVGKVGIEAGSQAVFGRSAPQAVSKNSIVENSVIMDEWMLNMAVQGPNKSEWRSLMPV